MPTRLEPAIVEDALNGLPGWSGSAEGLARTVELTDEQHREVEQRLMETADAMNHHPTIARDGDQTSFSLSTHSVGGVTELDVALASQISNHVRLVIGAPPTELPEAVLPAGQAAAREAGAEPHAHRADP